MHPSTSSTLPLSSAASPTYNHSESQITSLTTHLAQTHNIPSTSSNGLCRSRSSTAHSPAAPTHTPQAVFYPSSTQDVSIILRACHRRSVAVTAYCGGTSLGGALAATRGGVCVDFERMGKVLRVNREDMDVVVQAGVGWVELNKELEGEGVWVAVDPARGAGVGGMIAMGCSGTNAYRYGTMKNHVLSLTAVLADGTVVKTRNRPRKSSAGYDLTNLIIGSEGTLALVTEAVLKLTPLPKNLHVAMAVLPSMQIATDVAVKVLSSGEQLEAIEVMDRECMRAVNCLGSHERFEELPTLFLKFAGSRLSVEEQILFVKGLCEDRGLVAFEASGEKEKIEEIWGARKSLGHAIVGMKKDPDDVFVHTDAAVPISKLARLVEESERVVGEMGKGWFVCNVAHAGDGNTHTGLICPKEDKEEAEISLTSIQKLALELDGTITGEHGIGLKLRDLLCEEVGSAGVDAMRKIKFALDPKGILNPDKVMKLDLDI